MIYEDNTFSFQDVIRKAYTERIPLIATIEILTLCNLKCIHCYIAEHNNIGLEYDFLIDLFAQLKELGTFELVLTGGEIFLRSDIIDIIKKARNMGFRITSLSNATIIDDYQIQSLSDLYITEFSTTIFSLDEKLMIKLQG
ncbi:hypothetical protein JCM30566_19540 [Marinitoga arctica]